MEWKMRPGGRWSVLVVVLVLMITIMPATASDTLVTYVSEESVLVLPVETVDWATAALFDLELKIEPVQVSSPKLEVEIMVHNKGGTPFRIPDSLALPPGDLEIWYGAIGSPKQKQVLRIGLGVRGGSSTPQTYLQLPPKSSFARQVSIRYDQKNRYRPEPWPPGEYEVEVRMNLSADYEQLVGNESAWGVPRGIFRSNALRVRVE